MAEGLARDGHDGGRRKSEERCRCEKQSQRCLVGGQKPRGLVTRHAASGAYSAVHDRVSLIADRKVFRKAFRRENGGRTSAFRYCPCRERQMLCSQEMASFQARCKQKHRRLGSRSYLFVRTPSQVNYAIYAMDTLTVCTPSLSINYILAARSQRGVEAYASFWLFQKDTIIRGKRLGCLTSTTTIPRRVSVGLTLPRPIQHSFILKLIITKLPVVSGASKNSETGTCRVEARFVCTRQLHSTQDHHQSSSQPKPPFPPYFFPPLSPPYLRLILIPNTP